MAFHTVDQRDAVVKAVDGKRLTYERFDRLEVPRKY